MVTPDYYKDFVCIGGECQNNCCTGAWEIEVDDESLERFKTIGGEFGKRVMDSINGYNVFIRKNGICPLLSNDGWCEMVRHGEKLCIICDEYPRFTEYFDDYTERGISISCEAASKIVLGNKSKVKLVGNSGKCDEEIFKLLYNAREKIFEILQNRDVDIYKRMRYAIDYGMALQERINENDYSAFSYIPDDKKTNEKNMSDVFEFLCSLDILNDSWHEVLGKGIECEKNTRRHIADPIIAEQLAVYFVYRYFLKGVFDCDVLSKLKLMAVSVMSIIALGDICGSIYESARLYSVEIEHNEDNIDAIYDELLFNDELSVQNIINMIK